MKKLLLIVVLFYASLMSMAQDVIVKKDGSTIISKVEEISDMEIKYRKWSNQDGPMYTIRISDVARINFQNGTVESFSEETRPSVVSGRPSSDLPTFTDGELVLNGEVYKNNQKVSDEELRQLLGREWYEEYRSADRTANVGGTFGFIGILGVVFGGTSLVAGKVLDFPTATTIGIIELGIGVPCFIAWLAIPGASRQRDILNEYNLYNKSNKPTSAAKLQIAPSLMGGGYAQDNVGLGMTVAINF